MKYLFLFASLAIIGCSQQKKDCYKFKTGTFKYIDENLNHFTITRKDSVQIEYNNQNNMAITTSIEWTSQCTYVLTYKNITNYPNKNKAVGKKIYVQILETDNHSYTCQVSSNAIDTKYKIIKTVE